MADRINKKSKTTCFDLPGEIKNRIYRLVCVQHPSVLLRKTVKPTKLVEQKEKRTLVSLEKAVKSLTLDGKNGKLYCFTVGQPALMFACRETCRDVRAIYYEENTFLFTDGVISSAAVAAFERLCGPSAIKIRSLKVNHKPLIKSNLPLYYRFEVKAASDGITVHVGSNAVEIAHPEAWKLIDHYEKTYGDVCQCHVLHIAQRFKNPPPHKRILSAGGRLRNPIFEFLQAYAEDAVTREKTRTTECRVRELCLECEGKSQFK